jgi:head-tail adaptor
MRRKIDDYTAGEFRFKVQVQRVTYTPDGAGGQNKTWANHVVIFCFVEEKRVDERYSDSSLGRVRSEELWEFTTWKRGDIIVEDRLLWSDRIWNIRSVGNLLGRNKFTRIIAEAGVEQ